MRLILMFGKSLLCLLVPALVAGQTLPTRDRVVLAMGTELCLHFEGPGDPDRASEAALAEAARIEAACSTWDPASAWSRLNAAQGRPVALDREWLELLSRMKAWQSQTDGAFDPVLMALMRVWGIRQGGKTPDPQALAEARRAAGATLLELDLRRTRFRRSSVHLKRV